MADRLDNPKARKNRVICDSATVPEGWVVIGRHHSPACNGDGPNAKVVKQPGRREVVVADSPVPEGYRRVKETEITEGEIKVKGWLIERNTTEINYEL